MRNPNPRKHVSIDEYGSEEIPDVFGRGTQMQKSVAHTRIFSVLVHQNRVSNNKNVTYKCLMRNPDSRKHVLIDEYGSEEIPDVCGHRTQMQELVAHTIIFS